MLRQSAHEREDLRLRIGRAGREDDKKASFLAGRRKEAEDTYLGSGYTFDIHERIIRPGSKKGERKRQAEVQGYVNNAPTRGTIMDFGSAKRLFGKAFGGLDHNPWVEPMLKATALLPVGENLALDFGPPGKERKYHIKIARVRK